MPVVTLLSDFGEVDYYVAAFKGDLLTRFPDLQIIDITHSVPAYDINRAAYIIGNCYAHFPKGSIHLTRVYERGGGEDHIVLCMHDGHFFLGPDNGLLTLFIDNPNDVRAIPVDAIREQGLEEGYFSAIQSILSNKSLEEIGEPLGDLQVKMMPYPVIQEKVIRGVVMHIDHFGNAITNIEKSDFEQKVSRYGQFYIHYRRMETIDRISRDYGDVMMGEKLARFNSKEKMEIAINCGEASTLLGLREGNTIQIEFR